MAPNLQWLGLRWMHPPTRFVGMSLRGDVSRVSRLEPSRFGICEMPTHLCF